MTSERDSLQQEKEKLTVSLSELQTSLKSKEQELQQAKTQAEAEKVRNWPLAKKAVSSAHLDKWRRQHFTSLNL